MARRQRKNGRVKTPQRRFCARRLDRSSAKKRSHGSGIPASADIYKLFSNPEIKEWGASAMLLVAGIEGVENVDGYVAVADRKKKSLGS